MAPSRVFYIGLALTVLSLFLHEYTYKDFLIDDAFISFRYAENLIAGYGLVFNPMGDPVEGYTNFLWTLLFAGVLYLKLDPVPVAKALGGLLSFLNLGLTYGIARTINGKMGRWKDRRSRELEKEKTGDPWAVLPLLFLAISGPFAAWAMGGLETQLVTALNLLALHSYFKACFLTSTVFFTLASLTRPDAILLWGAVFLMHLFGKAKGRTGEWAKEEIPSGSLTLFPTCSTPRLLWPSISLLLPLGGFGLFWIWRWQYYGSFFPNTFYMKTGGGGYQIMAGIFYLLDYILSQGGFFPFLLFYFFKWNYGNYGHWVLLSQIGLYVVFIILSGGDWMPLHRFLVPLLPLLAILNTAALKDTYHRLILFLEKMNPSSRLENWENGRTNSPSSRSAALLLFILTGFFLIFPLLETFTEHPRVMEDSKGIQAFIEFGKWLGKQVLPYSLIAVNPVGAIPFYSRLNALDMTGLTDSHIAHLKMGGLHQKYDSAYILDHQPDFIILIGRYDPETQAYQATWMGEEDLFRHPEFQSGYQPIHQPIFKYKKEYSIILFQRKQ